MDNLAVPPAGAEQLLDSAGKSQVGDQRDVKSDAFSDVRLLKLSEVWPALSDDVKGEIARLAGLRPDDLNDDDDDNLLGRSSEQGKFASA
jgi:hypothetical protein